MLDDFVAAENITGRVNERLSVLLCDQSGKLIRVLLEEVLVLEHVADAGGDGHLRPSAESIFGVCDSSVELTLGGEGNLGDSVLRQGALDVESLGGSALDPTSVYEVFVLQNLASRVSFVKIWMEKEGLTSLLKLRLLVAWNIS